MTRNDAIEIMLVEIHTRGLPALNDAKARRVYATAYEDACRNLIRHLADYGAFDDGRNMADRMPPRLNLGERQ